MSSRSRRWLLSVVASCALAVPVAPVRGDDPPLSAEEQKKKEEKYRVDLANALARAREVLKDLSELVALAPPGALKPPVAELPAPTSGGGAALSLEQRRDLAFAASPVVGARGLSATTGLPVQLTRPVGVRDTRLSISIPTGRGPLSGAAPVDNGFRGALAAPEIPIDATVADLTRNMKPLDVERALAVERQIATAYAFGRRQEAAVSGTEPRPSQEARLANAERLGTASYGAGLMSESGHSPVAAQQVASYGEAPRFFAVRGGFGTYSPYDSAYSFSSDRETAAKSDSLVVISGSSKLSMVASSASNKRLKDLEFGREQPLHKGFNVDALAVDHQLVLGGFIGHIAAEYFENPSGNDDHIELIKANGTIGFRRRTEDVRDYASIAIGAMTVPVGLYNDNEWDYWAWSGRPFIYGRLFNGNLIGTGALGLVRFDPRDSSGLQRTDTDFVVRAGAFNAQDAKMQGFIGGDPVGGFTLDDKERYSLADLVYLGDIMGSKDLRHCHCEPLIVSGGVFGIYGPNGTGDAGETLFYGIRARALWLANRPDPKVDILDQLSDGFLIEGEWSKREYHVDGTSTTGPKNLEDWGGWASAIYTLRSPFADCGGALSFGFRYDYGSGRGDSATKSRHDDEMRDDRTRWTALIALDPGCGNEILKHFTFSLEYQRDEADTFDDAENTIVLGFQIR